MRCRIGEDEDPRGAREAARRARGALTDPEERALRRAAAGAAARPRRARGARQAGSVRRLAALLRAPRRRLPDRARLRGHAVGGREPARLRRVPARVVARLAALRDHARAARSSLERRPTWGAGQRNFTSLFLEPLSASAMEELLDGLVPGPARRGCAGRSSPAPRACRCTRSRRCGCCSTAGCSPRRARSTGRSGRSASSRCPRRCTR